MKDLIIHIIIVLLQKNKKIYTFIIIIKYACYGLKVKDIKNNKAKKMYEKQINIFLNNECLRQIDHLVL